MKNSQIQDLIRKLPKVELHLHIEGSLEPEMLYSLAKNKNIPLRFSSIEEIRNAYNFSNLQSFLDIYYEGAKVLTTEEDFYLLAMAYFKKMASENVCHCEIFFDPQTHTERGIEFSTVIKGLRRAQEEASKLGVSSFLIMCFLRHLSNEAAMQTLEQALPYKDWIKAVGLDSSEMGHPPSKFESTFKKALSHGFLTVAHAGEEGPPEYIWEALDKLKVSRIDHGVRCEEDPRLVERLKRARTPLTVCPLSNVKLKVFKELRSHNLGKLLDAGLCVTINSDDPAYFGGYLTENYLKTQVALNLSPEQVLKLALNSIEASFLSEERKKHFIGEAQTVFTKWKSPRA